VDMLDFFVRSAKAQGLYVGLAGGLQLAQVDSLADLSPDYLGFRSGLCLNQRREQPLIKEKLHLVTAKVSEFC
jgi:(5-formylfuran-3-yl)methyl phosphate synthase